MPRRLPRLVGLGDGLDGRLTEIEGLIAALQHVDVGRAIGAGSVDKVHLLVDQRLLDVVLGRGHVVVAHGKDLAQLMTRHILQSHRGPGHDLAGVRGPILELHFDRVGGKA